MPLADYFLHEFEELVVALRERLSSVATAALPVDDHAIRIYFCDWLHESDGNIILRLAIKGLGEWFQIVWITSIYFNFSALHWFLLDRSKEAIVTTAGAKSYYHRHHLLVLVLLLVVQQS